MLIEGVSDYCLTPSEHFSSHIMARTSYIFIRWWWCWWPLCTRTARRVGFL